MGLKFNIAKCDAWGPGLESLSDWTLWAEEKKQIADELALPALKSIPAMQRRRLSPFAKITLQCALEAAGPYASEVPAVFSSRHGDLHKTAQLIKDVVNKETLSPTHFGLSVHNAVAGLFSIYTQNKMPISAVASGKSSFLAGLVDCVSKAHANAYSRILYVYSDLVVPECYQKYVDNTEISLAVALLIEPVTSDGEPHFQLSAVQSPSEPLEQGGFQPTDFMRFYLSDQRQFQHSINQQSWSLTRHAG